jgi:hypothetical protein
VRESKDDGEAGRKQTPATDALPLKEKNTTHIKLLIPRRNTFPPPKAAACKEEDIIPLFHSFIDPFIQPILHRHQHRHQPTVSVSLTVLHSHIISDLENTQRYSITQRKSLFSRCLCIRRLLSALLPRMHFRRRRLSAGSP